MFVPRFSTAINTRVATSIKGIYKPDHLVRPLIKYVDESLHIVVFDEQNSLLMIVEFVLVLPLAGLCVASWWQLNSNSAANNNKIQKYVSM